jgi:hypothetical protein
VASASRLLAAIARRLSIGRTSVRRILNVSSCGKPLRRS